jgi:23S rRNA (guanosine2251-2'-O)-methyltransferase
MFLYGFHPVREALRHRPHEVERVLVGAGRTGRRREEIEALARRHGIAVEEVGEARLGELAGRAHNGLVAEVRAGGSAAADALRGAASGASPAARPGVASGARPDAASGPRSGAVQGEPSSLASGVPLPAAPDPRSAAAADALPLGLPTGDPQLVVLLEDVQDPRNLGAVLRVCEGAGVGRVLIRDRGAAPLTPAVVKTSAGASEWLDIERITNSANEIERLKAAGFWVYGTDAGGEPPWGIDLTGPVVLCFGGEERGLRQRTRALCDRTIGLPMRGRVGSLNLATAAAAVLYEAVRQRQG